MNYILFFLNLFHYDIRKTSFMRRIFQLERPFKWQSGFLNNVMRRGFFSLFFLLLYHTSDAAELHQPIYQLAQKMLPNATVGIVIQDVDGATLYTQNANTLLYPASNIKLYTAAAALYALGPEYHYETLLSQAGDDYYVTFTGAPDLTTSNLYTLLQPITHIAGDLMIDATRFLPPFYLAGVSYDDIGWYFTSPCSAIIIDENKEDYTVHASQALGGVAQFSSEKKPSVVHLTGQVRIVEPRVAQEQCDLNVTVKPHNVLYLDGCVTKQTEPLLMSFAVTDPMDMAKQVLAQGLQTQHIALQGTIKEGKTPQHAKIITRHSSASLSQLVEVMLQDSNNLYADSLTRTLGYQFAQRGSTKLGVWAMKSILEQKTGIDMQSIVLADGIGTRYNMSTAAHLTALLQHMYHDPHMQATFLHALPVMGRSGTLKDRMRDSVVANHVWAKTGSMHDMSSLSGFLQTAQGKILVFSIITNGLRHGEEAKRFEEKLLELLYTT